MDDQQLQLLITQLQSGNDQERRAASYKLGKSKSTSAVTALINAFYDRDGSVRRNVIEGLQVIGTQEALDFLNSNNLQVNDNSAKTNDNTNIKDDTHNTESDPTQLVQEFFSQEWRKRTFIVFLEETDLDKRNANKTEQPFKWLDWTGNHNKQDTKSVEVVLRAGLAYTTLGLSEAVLLGARGIKYASKKIGQKNYQKDVNVSFLSERYLELALVLGLLHEPEGSFGLKTVYAGHPYSKATYIPVAHFHELLFKEKAREIVRICSTLGASKLSVTYVRQQIKSSGGKGFLGAPIEIPMSVKAGIQNNSNRYQEIWHQATYKPAHAPSLPPKNELIWYETEPQWKQLVEDRLIHGLLEINLQVQSRQDYHVNGQLALDLQSMGLSLGGEWIEQTQSLLTVEGEFVPLHDLKN